jgi:hypothetical protein
MVLQYEYWPSLTWVQQLINNPEWQLEQWGNYQKQSLANRCKITGANGPVTLSVPLVAGREQKTLLKNVKIDNTQRWQVQHMRTIKSCYGKAPFFDYYFPLIENLLLQPYNTLIALDETIIIWLLKILKVNAKITRTQKFESFSAIDTLSECISIKPYVQVFQDRTGFVPQLSVLDGLFCLGPQITAHLKNEAAV